MSKLTDCLDKISTMSKSDRALLKQEAAALEAKGLGPLASAKKATKAAAAEIEAVFRDLRAATEATAPDALPALDAYYAGENLILAKMPAQHEAIARKLAAAGMRTPEAITKALGKEAEPWAAPMAQWIAKNAYNEMGGASFSIGPVQLPPTTQKSRTIAGPASIGLSDSNRNIAVFQSAPGEPGDVSPRGDGETNTSFSLGRAIENIEFWKNAVREAQEQLDMRISNDHSEASIQLQRNLVTSRQSKLAEVEAELAKLIPVPAPESRERKIYEKAANKVLSAKKELQEAKESAANALKDWKNIHGRVHEAHQEQYVLDDPEVKDLGAGKVQMRYGRFKNQYTTVLADRVIYKNRVLFEREGFDFSEFQDSAELIAARESLAQAEADLYLAEEDFDPETDARLADAQKIRHRELSKQASMFAALLDARDEEAKNAAGSFVAKVWKAFSKHDELFQFGKSTSKKAADIATAVSLPGRLITADENGDSVRFSGPNGHITIIDADTARPYIAASEAGSKDKKSGGGSQLYVAALDWIHNNGKRIKDDPGGLSTINAIRRTSNFFASAIRWGTTKHLKPHADQAVGKWTKNVVLNISLLGTKEMDNAHKAAPETRGWTFDFAAGKLLAANGEELTDQDFEQVVAAANPGTSGIGISTLQRAIITASAIDEFQRGTAESIVESAESALPDSLTGVSYSLGPAKVASIMSGNALARITDPRRRTQIMSRISQDFESMRHQIDRMAALSGVRRSKGDMRREAMAREDLRAEELIADVHRRFGEIMHDDDLVKIKQQPVHAALADPESPLRGRLKSKAAAIRQHPDMFQLHRAGDYDGSDGVSRSVFGGTRMPDQAAQELFDDGLIPEPTADALWEALLKEQNSVAAMKELLQKAKEQIREAKAQAKQEATEWLATQGKDQEVNFSDKEEIRRALRMYDAIMLALPPEARGNLASGYTQISMITTDEAKLAFLKNALAKADQYLETFLRVEYAKEWESLLARAAPKTNDAGQRPTGSIAADAYDVFREAEAAMGMSFSEGEARADMWDALADNPDTDLKDVDLARVKAQMVRLTMNWPSADAARREQAVLEGEKIYYNGLLALKIDNSRRRERLGGLRDSAVTGTGKTGHRMEREAKKQADSTKTGKLKSMAWEFLSFGQVVDVLFGEKSAFAQWSNAREMAASNAKHDGFQAKANALEALFDTLSGNRFGGEKLRHRMATVQAITVKDALGIAQSFTESQAIDFLLTYRQEDGKRHMQGLMDDSGKIISTWAWDNASAQKVEAGLSKEARAIMAFMGQSYSEEYGRINAVFRRIWNVSMPRHKLYAPISAKPSQVKADSIMDPESGNAMGVGLTPGSLKNRSFSAVTEIEFKDAFQKYLQHARQMEHFIAYGEFSRDALAIINRRETRNAIEAAGGLEAAMTLSKWVDYFALGGIPGSGGAQDSILAGILSRLSQAALVGRVSVLAMQSLQLAAASFKMPTGAFLTRFAKLTTGRLEWGASMSSEYIQRRQEQLPPVIRDMMAGMASGTPNRAKYLAGKMAMTIPGADALFTAGTYAIFYDYHLGQARELKLANPEAHAHKEAERLTDQVAQPVRPGARSWLEVANAGNPAFRSAWNFASDPRQKAALLVYAVMRRDTEGADKIRDVSFTAAKLWLIGGVLTTLLRTISRDLRNDDDDEVLDERYWSPLRLGLQVMTGPLGAVPFFGGMLEDATYKATGQYMPQGGLLSFLAQAAGLPLKWSKGKVEPLKDLETLTTAGAGFSGTSAVAASAMHLIRDVVGFIQNLEGPD